MKAENNYFKSKKSLIVEAYEKHKKKKDIIHEDDFFCHTQDDTDFLKKANRMLLMVRVLTSIPLIILLATLAYLYF